MHARLGPLILAASLSLLAACNNTDTGATPPTPSNSSAPPSPPTQAGAEPAALHLRGQFGKGTYCLKPGSEAEDYLYSGTWLTVRDDVTITGVAPQDSSAMEVKGSWIVEDGKDDGEFAPWSSDALSDRADLVRSRGAELTAGSSYRVALRLRPLDGRASQVTGIVVRYRDASGGGHVTDPSTLRIAANC